LLDDRKIQLVHYQCLSAAAGRKLFMRYDKIEAVDGAFAETVRTYPRLSFTIQLCIGLIRFIYWSD